MIAQGILTRGLGVNLDATVHIIANAFNLSLPLPLPNPNTPVEAGGGGRSLTAPHSARKSIYTPSTSTDNVTPGVLVSFSCIINGITADTSQQVQLSHHASVAIISQMQITKNDTFILIRDVVQG